MIVKFKNNCQFPASPGPAWFAPNADSHVIAFIRNEKLTAIAIVPGLASH
jgi:hypothetical protein